MSADTATAFAPAALSVDLSPRPRSASNRILAVAIGISVLFHAVVFTIKFVPPVNRFLENLAPPLEVVLVNSKSVHKPLKADALAQANLDGGGNTEQDRRAKTNLPVISDSTTTDTVSVASQRVQQLEQQVQAMMTQIKSDKLVEASKQPSRRPQDKADGRNPSDADQQKLEIERLQAQIARQVDRYQKLPKRKFIGARTDSVIYAQYVDDWRQRIERVGTRNFPQEAKRAGIFGTLLLTVSIKADGSVEKVEVERSSGFPILDKAALRIVELAGPFAPFPPAIKKEFDILSITRSWQFTREEEMVGE